MALFNPYKLMKPVRRSAKYWLASLFLLIFACSYAIADRKSSILFVASKPSADYVEVLNSVKQQLEILSPERYEFNTVFRSSEPELKADLAAADFIVTIGTAAADTVFSNRPKAPILSVLITENAFSALTEKHYGSTDAAFAAQVSSICLDQPVMRSIRLAKFLVPESSGVGVMLGPASAHRQAELSKYITDSALQPKFVSINAKDNPINKIEPVLSRSDVFIPISDSRLINIATAKWILHLSYRYKVPVIAFSKSYLKAGALAAIYSAPEDVAKDTVDWLMEPARAKVGSLNKPTHYSLNFNRSVAANLKIKLQTEQFYRDRINLEAR
ncbi:MAG: ABC transporter substrate binding protein [Porticoccaceae bacterium]|nr:ABC transporter substrate binding protein [Porticoccaceae bacterium]